MKIVIISFSVEGSNYHVMFFSLTM